MKLLDLFCGAGGAAMGYHRAGFTDITGIDIKKQKRYPFKFIQGDAIDYVEKHGHEYDIIHASPPCQFYTTAKSIRGNDHWNSIPATRDALKKTGLPYIIENVPGAKKYMVNPLMLCGTMFELDVIRHRYFECEPVIWFAPAVCNHYKPVADMGRVVNLDTHFMTVCGNFIGIENGRKAMGIDWMTQAELAQSIPPAYTEYIGKQLIKQWGVCKICFTGIDTQESDVFFICTNCEAIYDLR